MLRSLVVLPLLALAACGGGGSSAPSPGDISTAFRSAGASNVVVVPSSVWQAAFDQGVMEGVPVEGAKAQMAHIDSEVGGTFGQSMFLVQVMDSAEAAQKLVATMRRTGSKQPGGVVSKVLVHDRLVGWYAGDQGHVASFTKAFDGLQMPNPAPPTDDYPDHLVRACHAFLDDGWKAGAVALQPLAGLVWWEVIKRPVVSSTRVTDAARAAGRQFMPKRAGATYVRDRFHCRYCGGKVLAVALMSLLSHIYPEALPYVSTYRRGYIHPVYWTRGAEADHVQPGACGGDWLDPENHATACARCNTMKSRYTLDELGWSLLPVPTTDWDGLVGVYPPLWAAAGFPDERYHRRWIAALGGDPAGRFAT